MSNLRQEKAKGEVLLPKLEASRQRYSLMFFCIFFPDAFVVSEPREQMLRRSLLVLMAVFRKAQVPLLSFPPANVRPV